MEKPKLRTNVIKYAYTFRVLYAGKKEELVRVEAESIDAAIEKLPQPRITASLLTREEV